MAQNYKNTYSPCPNCNLNTNGITTHFSDLSGNRVHGCNACQLSITGHFFGHVVLGECPNGHPYNNNLDGLHHWCFGCQPQARPPKWYKSDKLVCDMCKTPFTPENKRGITPKFCGNACKQKNYRQNQKKS